MPGLIKDNEAESAHNEKAQSTQNWACDLSAILPRLAEGAFQADKQKRDACPEKQEVHPGNIPGNWKPGKYQKVAGKRDQAEQKPCPQVPVPSALIHRDNSRLLVSEKWMASPT
jgi:hypothetical protein